MQQRTYLRLCFALFSLIAISAIASEFKISPYVYPIIKNHSYAGLGIAWEYKDTALPNEMVTVTLRTHGHVTSTLGVDLDESLFHQTLPIPACGFGDGISYQVTGMDLPRSLTNIPCDNQPTASLSFITDTQEYPERVIPFSKLIHDFSPNIILHGGDLVQTGGNHDHWVDFFDVTSVFNGSHMSFSAVGNHEYRKGINSTNLWSYFFRQPMGKSYYSTHIGPVRLIILNSCFEHDDSIKGPQLAWLKEELKFPAPWTIMLFHHPPYSHSLSHSGLSPYREYIHLQKYYVPLFEAYNVDLVLAGHTHLYERAIKNGVHYVNGGASGGKMGLKGGRSKYINRSEKTRTISHIEANKNNLRLVSVLNDGSEVDRLELKK